MTSRRHFLALLAGAGFPGLLAAQPARQASQPRVGILMSGDRASAVAWLATFRSAATAVGMRAGIELRFADGKADLLPSLAQEFAGSVQAIVATDEPAFKAAKAAAGEKPVLAGNLVTPIDLAPQEMALLAAFMPKLSHIGVLVNPKNSSHRPFFNAIGAAAERRKWAAAGVEVEVADDLEQAFEEMAANDVRAVVIAPDGLFSQEVAQIAELGRQRRFATVGQEARYAEGGCLFSCGQDPEPAFRALAAQVGRVVKGEKLALPAQFRPARVPVVVNRATAKAIGVAIPARIEKTARFV